ncbi:hypothetical protein HZB78_02905 [Candidatus Collierbacteria bacterium]|nr:hypothetical protein [Candidatus Collierbacteria bacterium]
MKKTFVYLSITSSAFAAGITNPVLKGDLGSGNPNDVFGRYVGTFWGLAYTAGALIFLLYFVWGGIEWIMGGGNKDRVENAKSKISNGLLGLSLLAGSFALVKAIGYVLGIDVLANLEIVVKNLSPLGGRTQ